MAKHSSGGRKVFLRIARYVLHVGKQISLDPYLTSYTKIDLKWIVDLGTKAKITKLQRKMEYLHDLLRSRQKVQVGMVYSSR